MSYLNALLTDLRDRKLWPVPLVLLAALVAVPVLLTKSPAAQHPAPIPGLSISNAQTGSAVTVAATPIQASLNAGTRDPFTQQKLPGTSSSSISGPTTPGGGSGATVASGGSTGSTTSSGSTGGAGSTSTGGTTATGGSTTGSTGSSTPTTPTTPPTPTHPVVPAGLTAAEAYHVSLSITDASGGVSPLDPFQRDGVLPNHQHPLLVELGVAQGGHRVLFSVQPGAVVRGPGSCTPGPLDCEILSVAPGQTEGVSGSGAAPTLFQITGIAVDRFGSKAAAQAARAKTDGLGRRLLANSTSSTLSLFQYDPSLDAVVDGRNLTVGGN